MKKLLLGLGASALAIIPVAAVVSCSTSESKLEDLAITLKNVTQETISKAAVILSNKESTDTEKLEALETVFFNVKEEGQLKNFEFKVTGDAGKEVITLTANKGYSFGGKETTLVSKPISQEFADEIAKYSGKSFESKLKDITSEEAKTKLDEATLADKDKVLAELIDFTAVDGFVYVVKEGAISEENTLIVTLQIKDITTQVAVSVDLTINGFKEVVGETPEEVNPAQIPAGLKAQAEKFRDPMLATEVGKKFTTQEVAFRINIAGVPKVDMLNHFVKLPTLDEGFTLQVVQVAPSSFSSSQLIVMVNIVDTTNIVYLPVAFTVSEFKA